MALIKCPDCEKMISPRVEICPFCGCPSKFFIQGDRTEGVNFPNSRGEEKEEATTSISFKEIEFEEIEREEVNENIYFSLGPKQVFYDKKTASFAAMFGDYRKIADDALSEAFQRYNSANSFESALNGVRSYAKAIINDTVSAGVKFLYEHRVIIPNSEFIDRYDIDYGYYTNDARQAYTYVMNEKKEMEAYRAAEKASRSRWQGGGFGLKGALKGAATAGALNLGSDLLHSFGDASRASQDNKVIQGKTKDIYQQYKNEICGGVYFCILKIYDGMVTELEKINFFEEVIPLNEEKADKLFEVTMQNASSEDEILNNMLTCISMFPGNKKITDTLVPLLSAYRGVEFGEWLEFWHLDYRYPNYKENKQKADEFDEFLSEKGIEKFNFKDPNVAPYVRLRKWIYEYYKKYNVDTIPKTAFFADAIKEYYGHIKGAMTWYDVIEWVPLECDIFEFMTYMNKEREGLVHSFLPQLWLYGDSEEDIPSKLYNYLDSGERILMFHDSSFLENGRKGFMVTTKGIYDLKTCTKFLLPDIEEIQVYSNGSIEIVRDNEIIRIKESDLNDDEALNHLAKLLKVICVRYAGNDKLWEEKMSTPRPANKVYDIAKYVKSEPSNKIVICSSCGKSVFYGIKFCNFCGNPMDNSKKVQLIGGKIICKSCGKEISEEAKFCSFCGNPNNKK